MGYNETPFPVKEIIMTRDQKTAIIKSLAITAATVTTVVVSRIAVNKILTKAFLPELNETAN